MEEYEALREYSKRFIYDGYELTQDDLKIIRKSLGFNRYLLGMACDDLVKAIYNALPKWVKRF